MGTSFMRLSFPVALSSALMAFGCASTANLPAGMKAGQFVQLSCEGGKSFQARVADDGSSVRVRYEGGYELSLKSPGVFESDGWNLDTTKQNQLTHNGKVLLKNCRPGA